uniref:phage portal protein n=1 Tax=Jeotgalibaca porci TaxID=1868793 RepID=UPI0035A0BE57
MSKIISGGAKGIVPIQKQAVSVIKKKKLLKYNQIGGVEQRRDLTLLSPPYDLASLREVTDISDILNQSIEAYVKNVVGFGMDIRYTIDDTEETDDMKKEWLLLESLLKDLSFERSGIEVLEEVLRAVEECGNGYIEVVRNVLGDVVGIDSIKPEYMTVSKLNRVIDNDGREIKVRYFCYQDAIEDTAIEFGTWFKSFGDPTPLNVNGSIAKEGQGTATEVVHIKIGDFHDPYGKPRWIGPLIKVLGNRKADELNYRYFTQGRHIPLAILTENAQLTAESESTLQSYANGIGAEGDVQHKFLLLEVEKVSPTEEMYGSDEKTKASIRIEKLADILQNDALFLEYNANTKEAVLSSFRLPPVYVGLSSDYNRATVETAKEITEEQVFQPLRAFYNLRINALFREYGFKYVEVYLRSSDITKMEDVKAILTPAIQANAVAPNDLRDLLSKVLNKPLEAFEGDEYNLPMRARKRDYDLNVVSDEPLEQEIDVAKAYGEGPVHELMASIRRLVRKEKKDDG